MTNWQSGLQAAAGTPNLFLTIWDLDDRGFSPKKFPAGTGTPVAIGDLRQVPIAFTSVPPEDGRWLSLLKGGMEQWQTGQSL